jgi:DNA modification methylase/DNA-directed RNA polymerase subunit RPC12/RpoP
MKLTKEDIDKVRHIDGFPIAKDEDIIALSDPPYYTACPNPFIEDFIKKHGKPYDEATDDYHREPFAADVSEGKNDPIYNAHSYHTKVPYKAIMRYILHYTEPGDIVFDGFCGTGMTGVAAQMCGNPDPELKAKIEAEMPYVKWGTRKALLCDLSPLATFISENYCLSNNFNDFSKIVTSLLKQCYDEMGWMYRTRHVSKDNLGQIKQNENEFGIIDYVVWSEILICPHCGEELVYWDVVVDWKQAEERKVFSCPYCSLRVKKRECEKAKQLYFDYIQCTTVSATKQVPVLIKYSYNGAKYEKTPDEEDIELLSKIKDQPIYDWIPSDKIPIGDKTGEPIRYGINYVYQFYFDRSLRVLSSIYKRILSQNDLRLLTILTSIVSRNAFKCNRFIINKHNPRGRINGPKSGTYYIPPLTVEQNVFELIKYKLNSLLQMYSIKDNSNILITTQSTSGINQIQNNSIDYIFTDPPFGYNIEYSELSFVAETWLKVKTNNREEAVINKTQKKTLSEYQKLMEKCFRTYCRALKPGRWITIAFHNSQNSIWNSIQEALSKVGFIVADVRILDKKRESLNQLLKGLVVKQELVISAYKPKDSFKRFFISHAGSEETAWSFVRQHLEKLPVVVIKNGKIELIAERQAFLLYDRMVAYHVVNGIPVPLDATDFYKGLDGRFLKRDGMYFLTDQVNEYDTARIVNDVEPVQFALFVTNEKSAIAWLYQQLETPQTYAELQPKFMQEIKVWDKFEVRPELSVLLEENFLRDDEGRWYIPDITKASDVAKLREKKLLKEFEGYLATKGKLKLFRTEAIRAGFAKLWAEKNYKLIVETAERLPESVIQEDDKLLMYYDISLGRI